MDIDPKQVKLIHIAKSQLGLDDALYREMLMAMFKAESSKSLTYEQADTLITHFKRQGWRVKAKRKCSICGPRPKRDKLPDNVVLLPSREQLLMIEHLKADIRWKHWDGYRRWLKKYFHLDQIKTSIDASLVIEGLKGIWRAQNPCPVKCRRAGKGIEGVRGNNAG